MSTALAESLHFLDTFWQEAPDAGDERGDYVRHSTSQLATWQHSWKSWTQRPLPLVLEAREAFRDMQTAPRTRSTAGVLEFYLRTRGIELRALAQGDDRR